MNESSENQLILDLNLPEEGRARLVDELPSLLLAEAPLPVFTLRFIYQLLAVWPEEFRPLLPKSGVCEVLITLIEIECTDQATFALQKQLLPLIRIIWEIQSLDSVNILLDNDFAEVRKYQQKSPNSHFIFQDQFQILLNVPTNRPRRHSCLTFGTSQSQWSMSMNSLG